MEIDFWEERWTKNEIGFHRPIVSPSLLNFWPQQRLSSPSAVLVPLCGKTLDLWWLAEQGNTVIGIELSEKAVQDCFAEAGKIPSTKRANNITCYQYEQVAILQGDLFAVTPDVLQSLMLPPPTALFDRAALIALPRDMRGRYIEQLASLLPPQFPGLVETIDYPHPERRTPPFPLPDQEVTERYSTVTTITRIAQNSLLGKEKRFTINHYDWAHENIYLLGLPPAS